MSFPLWFILILLGVSLEVGRCVRLWQSNLNFNNPHNWSPERLPCPADRMVLQGSTPLVLQLPEGQTSVSGMVLGGNVELVMLKDGSVHLTSANRTAKCPGQDVVFKHTQPLRWVDPSNWDGWTRATPDLERVPCAEDDVKFTPGATFNIITPPTLKLGSLQINGLMINMFDWYEHSTQEDSSWQLHKPDGDEPDLVITTSCPDDEWCECDNEYLHSEICTAVCPLPLCKEPVKPSGSCCHICGAYFLIRSKEQTKSHLTAVINSFLKNKDVAWHASKVGELVQLVLVENGDYSGEIDAIANELKILIEKNSAGWRVEQLFASGHVWYPFSFTQVATHFFSLMVFAALSIAGIVVFYSNNWTWLQFSPSGGRPFVFARFENQSGEVVVAHEQRQPPPPTPPQAFDNPMYGATGQEQRNVTVENPVYTELEVLVERCSDQESVDLNPPDLPKC